MKTLYSDSQTLEVLLGGMFSRGGPSPPQATSGKRVWAPYWLAEPAMSQRVLAEAPPARFPDWGCHSSRVPPCPWQGYRFSFGFYFLACWIHWSPSSTRADITPLREKGRKFSLPQGLPALFLKQQPAGPLRPEMRVPSALQKGVLERDRSSRTETTGWRSSTPTERRCPPASRETPGS